MVKNLYAKTVKDLVQHLESYPESTKITSISEGPVWVAVLKLGVGKDADVRLIVGENIG